MEEEKKYTGFSIPKRDMLSDTMTPDTAALDMRLPAGNTAMKWTSFDSAVFAEVDLAANRHQTAGGETAVRFYSSVVPPAQPIKQRAADPIRQIFFDMRSLASGRPFARNDSELFYKQAKLMEDFTDEYNGDARFNMYYPYYQHMGYEQLHIFYLAY